MGIAVELAVVDVLVVGLVVVGVLGENEVGIELGVGVEEVEVGIPEFARESRVPSSSALSSSPSSSTMRAAKAFWTSTGLGRKSATVNAVRWGLLCLTSTYPGSVTQKDGSSSSSSMSLAEGLFPPPPRQLELMCPVLPHWKHGRFSGLIGAVLHCVLSWPDLPQFAHMGLAILVDGRLRRNGGPRAFTRFVSGVPCRSSPGDS